MCWGKSFNVEPSGPLISSRWRRAARRVHIKRIRFWLGFLVNLGPEPIRHANALFVGEFLKCDTFLLCEANVNPAGSFVHGRIIGTEIKYGQGVFYS